MLYLIIKNIKKDYNPEIVVTNIESCKAFRKEGGEWNIEKFSNQGILNTNKEGRKMILTNLENQLILNQSSGQPIDSNQSSGEPIDSTNLVENQLILTN